MIINFFLSMLLDNLDKQLSKDHRVNIKTNKSLAPFDSVSKYLPSSFSFSLSFFPFQGDTKDINKYTLSFT